MTEVQKIMGVIRAAYPKFEPTQAAVYSRYLADIPVELLKRAVDQIIRTSKFLPTIAEIRERAAEISKEASGRIDASADAEWEKVYRAIGTIGPYFKVKFENPITNAAVKQIGWRTLCGSEESAMPFLRQQFIRAWDGLNRREKIKRRAQASLSGNNVASLVNGFIDRIENRSHQKRLKVNNGKGWTNHEKL